VKGASQVDWAISMGIFLIYVLGLLVFLRPGIQPVLENNLLISIIQDNLEEEVNVKLKRTPLFINISDNTKKSPPPSGSYKLEINDPLPFEGKEEEFALLDKDNNFVNFDLTSGKKLRFDGLVKKGELNLFWLLFLENDSYNNLNPIEDADINNEKNFSYSYGVTEEIVGIDYDKLILLDQNVDRLKEKWNFPKSKDFSIILINTTSSQYNQSSVVFSYNEKKETQQTNVFVREWKSWIISNQGRLSGVIFNVRVGEFE
jgi:hypothetical protein|tara:strand:+ start:42767 stop:43543 length:777 start_codon:yes stop_codon:yes gene_type:complete